MKNYQFYHIYPLGMLDKLRNSNDLNLNNLSDFIPHLKDMNINALQIGPIFKSIYHGYDTVDYKQIDPRLGSNEDFKQMVNRYHDNDIDVIVDCVFNHVSRDFFAFKDIIELKENSKYLHWFYINTNANNHRNDGFTYETWDGHDELVKLNLDNSEVVNYLIDVAKFWFYEFKIDGLRLDAADVMKPHFIRKLNDEMKNLKSDFFIVGEMVHGDYGHLLKETGIDSITNYECYKGLYSSLNDNNYYEIAYSFKRLFGHGGMIEHNYLYNFVDNHDVNRVASEIKDLKHLYPLYIMMYTMSGFTSIYYKSELGASGKRSHTSDYDLRQAFFLNELDQQNNLLKAIKKLSEIRHDEPVLAFGEYEELVVNHSLIGYRRFKDGKSIIILINSSEEPSVIDKSIVSHWQNKYGLKGFDLLNAESINSTQHLIVYPNWARILT